MTVHRPLSDWVARVDAYDGRRLGAINDGLERVDARTLPVFQHGWDRKLIETATEGGRRCEALGLQSPDTGETVVELDDYSFPLEVDKDGLALIDAVETAWPDPQLDDARLDGLRALSPEIRYFLLKRMAAEGAPGSRWFHALPWELVERAVVELTAMLDGHAAEAVELRHWLTPAITGVTGAIEQLHMGLAEGEAELARIGATAVCDGLLRADADRIPFRAAELLAALARRLGDDDPFLQHAAAVAASRFEPASPGATFTLDLTANLTLAASGEDARAQSERMRDASPLTVGTRVTAGRRLIVTAQFAIASSPERERLLGRFPVAVLPIEVRSLERVQTFWAPLEARRGWVSGTLQLPVPADRFRISADRPPVGAHEMSTVHPDELSPSFQAANSAGIDAWARLADHPAVEHTVRAALSRFDQSWSE
jgi:hypothetical protein